MANELTIWSTSGQTIYALIRKASDDTIWQTTTAAFVSWNAANIANYDVALSAGASDDYYTADMPSGITTAGYYRIGYFAQAGGSPATSDTPLGADEFYWNGTALQTAPGGSGPAGGTETVTLARAYLLRQARNATDTSLYSVAFQDDAIAGALNHVTKKYKLLKYVTAITIYPRYSGSDGAITSSDATFTSAGTTFTSADVGAYIKVIGAGAAGADLETTIASYTSAHVVELTATAGTTVTDATFYYAETAAALANPASVSLTDLPSDWRPEMFTGDGVTVTDENGGVLDDQESSQLTRISYSELMQLAAEDTSTGIPSHISFEGWSTCRVWPSPDDVYILRFHYWLPEVTWTHGGASVTLRTPADILYPVLDTLGIIKFQGNDVEHMAMVDRKKQEWKELEASFASPGNLAATVSFRDSLRTLSSRRRV